MVVGAALATKPWASQPPALSERRRILLNQTDCRFSRGGWRWRLDLDVVPEFQRFPQPLDSVLHHAPTERVPPAPARCAHRAGRLWIAAATSGARPAPPDCPRTGAVPGPSRHA